MRITGYGGGAGQGSGGRQRADIFRSRHHIGERLRGRILRNESGGLTLVEVDGQELLAQLETQAAPGDTLYFIVRALQPEIHLQALQGNGMAYDAPSLLQSFRTAREQFELCCAPFLEAQPLSLPPSTTQPLAFVSMLDGDQETATLFAHVRTLLDQIQTTLATPRGRTVGYWPWMFPGLRHMETLIKSSTSQENTLPLLEFAASGSTARYGALELRIISRSPLHNVRVYVERTSHLEEVTALVREALGTNGDNLTLGRISEPYPGGVFGELVGAATTRLSGGLNARV